MASTADRRTERVPERTASTANGQTVDGYWSERLDSGQKERVLEQRLLQQMDGAFLSNEEKRS